jgi:hypothetical protein
MKILIRDYLTGHYLDGTGNWIAEREAAQQFANSFAAIRFCAEKKIEKYEVLLNDTGALWEIAIPPRFNLFQRAEDELASA